MGGTLTIALGSSRTEGVNNLSANPAQPISSPLTKVLIANRGEIAVRIIRAARDEGIASVAVYADPDRDALHVRLADEAYALGGNTAAESYLVMDKIIDVAKQSGADAIHPGYGFLAENADFAAKVIDAGITWIGPSPEAISALGDKVQARHIAEKVGAPLVPGTADPVESADEILKFAEEFGLPVAIKAAFGGGGRGIKVARTMDEIPELYESAVREAIAAFGRGECFIERFLDAPRHVETQCLADAFGNVVVVSTRDCSLQRRNQKLVEEAPAPYLTEEQNKRLYESSKAILKEANYLGAGTCEFLVGQDGTISFLEVNTRLQVEHCVSEEVTGIDLVREQFRIARGEALGYDDPEVRGHSFEFRITGEDPGRNFMPAPGTITTLKNPTGPGVRIDSGVEQGDVISGNFDSMLSKLIITGATREQALQRSRRALEEMVVEGIPTVIPFDLAVVTDPAFAPAEGPFKVHTRWIETEFVNSIPAWSASTAGTDTADAGERQRVVVEVGGKRLEVVLPSGLGGGVAAVSSGPGTKSGKSKKRSRSAGAAAAAAGGNALTSPMQGTIVKVAAAEGDVVAEGDLIVVLEAMKMEQPLTAHKAGTVRGLAATAGETVAAVVIGLLRTRCSRSPCPWSRASARAR
ncbi:biotin carboxylase N-terminal domain-containing protein [Paenarthrobacter sp. CCNWYY172]|uniref:acetyl/propionyl/methylcrotonyl-CoA carboxylase subunit alpha n=1 Tax=unclassified Paenarthrobacter TaxID=2634190 RepID=UPI00307832C2